LKTSPTYYGMLRRTGGQDSMNARLDGPDGATIIWVLPDPVASDGWGSARMAMVEGLLPHIRQFVRVRQALVRAEARNTTVTALLDNPRVGVLHLDRRGRSIEANDRARSILRHGDGLKDRNGTLRARAPADQARLERLVGDAPPTSGTAAVSGSMLLRRSPVLPPFVMHVKPVGRPATGLRRAARCGARADRRARAPASYRPPPSGQDPGADAAGGHADSACIFSRNTLRCSVRLVGKGVDTMRRVVFALFWLAAQPVAAQVQPASAIPAFEPVTWDRLLAAADEPENWLMYSGTFDSQRFSRLDEIHTGNVGQLEFKWAYQIPSSDGAETTPLVVDGVMFLTEPSNNVVALDAATGDQFWRYEHDLPEDLRICCGRHNRGVAILGDTLYMSTLDAHLVAIDARNGHLVWNTEVAAHDRGHSKTAAPLVVKDQVVTGIAGSDFGIRGFLDAYDARDGERRWRTYTIPGPDDPGGQTWSGETWRTGGAPTWLTGSYDPELDLVYWGTGNPVPHHFGDVRPGDNLYSDSALALDADTGELTWYFQFTPHDVHHWDANQIPVLADLEIHGTPRRAMLWANRNGFYYTLDRETGDFLLGKSFARQTWADGLDENGRPMRRPDLSPDLIGTVVGPPTSGATNWMSPAYSPRTRLLYVMSFDGDGEFVRHHEYSQARSYIGGEQWTLPNEARASAVRAIDPRTGEHAWEYPVYPQTWAGLLTTAGGLVFGGSADGLFYALDGRSGDELWRVPVWAPVRAAPISYAVNGQQHVAIAAGNVIYSFGLPTSDANERGSSDDRIQAHFARELTRDDFRSVSAAWHAAINIPARDMSHELRTALTIAINRELDRPEAEDDHYLVSLAEKAMEIARLPDQSAAISMVDALARFPVNSWQLSEILVSLGSPAFCEVVKTITASESTDFMRWGALGTLERFVDDWGKDRLDALVLEDGCLATDRLFGHAITRGSTALGVTRHIAHSFLEGSSGYLPLSAAIGLAAVLQDEELRDLMEEFVANDAKIRGLGFSESLAADIQRIVRDRLENSTPRWRRQVR